MNYRENALLISWHLKNLSCSQFSPKVQNICYKGQKIPRDIGRWQNIIQLENKNKNEIRGDHFIFDRDGGGVGKYRKEFLQNVVQNERNQRNILQANEWKLI